MDIQVLKKINKRTTHTYSDEGYSGLLPNLSNPLSRILQ